MKVLVIGPSETKSRGGMATVIRDIHNSRILKEEYEVDAFASYIDGSLPLRLLYAGFAYVKFLLSYRKYDLFHIHAASNNSTFRKRLYLKVIKRAGKPAIVHIHGAKYLVRFATLPAKKQAKVLDFLNSADMVLALSEQWKQDFEDTFHITNCCVLHNGVDTEDFSPCLTDATEHVKEFLLLGNLGQRKGVYDLIDAMELAVSQDPAIRLYLAGDGEIERVKALIREKKLENNIQVVGWVDQAGKLECLKKVSTLVLPSYHEGLPMSVLEGMAAGKAIISTTVGAIPEVVKKENGVLITPGDVKALSEALVNFAADPAQLDAMSRANTEKIQSQFSLQAMHRRLLRYYQKVTEDV